MNIFLFYIHLYHGNTVIDNRSSPADESTGFIDRRASIYDFTGWTRKKLSIYFCIYRDALSCTTIFVLSLNATELHKTFSSNLKHIGVFLTKILCHANIHKSSVILAYVASTV